MLQKIKNERLTEEMPETSIVNIYSDLEKKECRDTGKRRERKIKDLIGRIFGRLKVIRFICIDNSHRSIWECLCECGIIKNFCRSTLIAGHSKSCGCLRKENARIKFTTHNKSQSKEYRTWNSMIQRCENQNSVGFRYYGERGIKVCQKWHKFENFYEDMGERPKGNTLDRIDNNLHYSCGKCEECIQNGWKFNNRWATPQKQNFNKRNTLKITYNGKTQSLVEWSIELGINKKALESRIYRYNWSIEKAFSIPIMSQYQQNNNNKIKIIELKKRIKALETELQEIKNKTIR